MPLIRLLLMMNSRRDSYVKSLMTEVMILCYQRSVNSPAWQMFVSNFSLFNEEVGEMSYSCLSRMTMHDSKKGDINHVSMLYCLIRDYAAINDEIWADHDRKSMRNGSVTLKMNSPVGVQARAFMAKVVQQLSREEYFIYPTRTQVKGKTSQLSNTRTQL